MKETSSLRLASDDRGVSAVEFALLLPVFLTLLLGSVTVFDLFRTAQSVEKATFTVGDMLSRQTAISESTLQSMLIFLDNVVNNNGTALVRVSSITNEHGALEIDWSESAGDLTIDIPSVSLASIPDIAPGDSVIYTEAFFLHQAFVPVFGLDYITYQRDSAHRPRFVGKIAWQR